MGLKAGFLALFVFVWIIGAFLGSTFEYQNSGVQQGVDYTTGTANFTNGSDNVTGDGTAWTAAMEGGNIMANADAIWNKIKDVVSTTELTLYNDYNGAGGTTMAYTMAVSPGWSGNGTGGYTQSPVNTLEYLANIKNVTQRIEVLGDFPLPIPNPEYFKAMFRVITWKWSFMDEIPFVYWIVCVPFVLMGIVSLILLIYGVITGNVGIA